MTKKPKMTVTMTSHLHQKDGSVKVIGPRKLKVRNTPHDRAPRRKSA